MAYALPLYVIPGVFTILAAKVIVDNNMNVFYNGNIVPPGTDLFDRISDALTDIFLKEADKAKWNVPNRLKIVDVYTGGPEDDGDGHESVDLSRFSERIRGKKAFRDPDTGYYIEKDLAGHGGREWKLFDRFGKRIASLGSNGEILGLWKKNMKLWIVK